MSEDPQAYLEAGAARARALGNRGPLRFDARGQLAPEIREAYDRVGFYVFEGVIDTRELDELDAEFEEVINAVHTGSPGFLRLNVQQTE